MQLFQLISDRLKLPHQKKKKKVDELYLFLGLAYLQYFFVLNIQ